MILRNLLILQRILLSDLAFVTNIVFTLKEFLYYAHANHRILYFKYTTYFIKQQTTCMYKTYRPYTYVTPTYMFWRSTIVIRE